MKPVPCSLLWGNLCNIYKIIFKNRLYITKQENYSFDRNKIRIKIRINTVDFYKERSDNKDQQGGTKSILARRRRSRATAAHVRPEQRGRFKPWDLAASAICLAWSLEAQREGRILYMEDTFQDKIRILVKKMIMNSGCGHAGGSLSMAEILASLYEDVMRYDPQDPNWPQRDRFILSKGHSALGLYAAMHLAGYFEESLLYTFATPDGALMNHPDKSVLPGLEVSTGSLGHGLSLAVGMALAGQQRDQGYFVYCLMGDAEIQEGSVWEAAMFASSYHLKRLVAIVDRNHIGNDGPIDPFVDLDPLVDKWTSFGFKAVPVDGHDRSAITSHLKRFREESDGPYVLIAETIKGKGLVDGLAGTGAAHYLKGSPEEISAKFLL